MGAWGYEIFEDDFTCDVKDEFEEYVEEGMPVEKALKVISKEYKEIIEDEETDYALFYLAVASIQLEHGILSDKVRKETLRIIDEGVGLELWEEEEEGLAARKKVLEEFKQKLLK